MTEKPLRHQLHEAEQTLLAEVRKIRQQKRGIAGEPTAPRLTTGQRIADAVASTLGSWGAVSQTRTALHAMRLGL